MPLASEPSTLHPDAQPGLGFKATDALPHVTVRVIFESPSGRTLEVKADKVILPTIWTHALRDKSQISFEDLGRVIRDMEQINISFVPLEPEPGHSIYSIIHQNWTTSQQKRIAEDLPGGDS